jgi:hypothetical protein
MRGRAWIVKMTEGSTLLSTQIFDSERSAQCFVQRTAAALKDKCDCKILRHVVRIEEEIFEEFPRHFPLKSSKREIVILEANFTERRKKPLQQ